MHDRFVARVERFIKRHKIAPSRFGRDAVRDQNFVFELRGGKILRPDRMDQVEAYMRDYKSRAETSAPLQAAE